MAEQQRMLFLCGGTQSSGSTLISWCFLQRSDMDGVLDADNDILPPLPTELGKPHAWYKTTISCFRLSELVEHYQDEGWEVRPLIVVRDVRHVWASLCKKPYGRNGITAEDPPLRLRLRRFKADWELFRQQAWPMIRYEDFVNEPAGVLGDACAKLGLRWDDAMLTWPKDRSAIAGTKHGNQTFRQTRGAGLLDTIRPTDSELKAGSVPPGDLEWLDHEFREFNLANNYPVHLPVASNGKETSHRAVPTFEMTRRHKWEIRRKPIRWFLHSLGFRQLRTLETAR